MLQIRPTFSESWYRVAGLKVKLRASAQISRQFHRGELWYVVRDPAGNQYHRLSDAAYRFVGLLDGTRTVAECWDLVGGQLADDAPTQPEVIQILSQLYSANLVEADVTPDATVLLRRHQQIMKRQLQGRLMNILFPRIPVWDPDRFLKRWMPVAKACLSKVGMVVWIGMIIAAIAKIAPMMPELKQAAMDSIDPSNWMLLWLTFALIKFWHELGHAFMIRRFGGEAHEMGIMFLVFIPTPYVEASASYAFANRWHRIAVGAGGMIFELFLAAILVFVWANTSPSTLIHQLSFNAMLIASVTTVLFNANPLLRYDGYYMLSDWLEIPNLQQKSQEYTLGLIKRHIFRLKLRQPLPPPGQRIWLFIYCICSTIYRVIVGVTIIMVVAWKVPVLGILMAMAGVATWILLPIIKVGKYVLLEPELHRKRGRAAVFALAVMAALVILVGIIPFPVHYRAEGYTEAENREVLNALVPGFVREIRVKDGDEVKAGQILLVCQDEELELQVQQVQYTLKQLHEQLNKARVEDANQKASIEKKIETTGKQLAKFQEKLGQLTVRSKIDGRVIAPHMRELKNKYVQRGEELATVAVMDKLLIKVTLQQSEAQLRTMPNRPEVEVRMAGAIPSFGFEHAPLKTVDVQLIPAAQKELPNPILGQLGGGEIQTSPKDPTKPLIEQFELRVWVDNPPGTYAAGRQFYPGQRAYLRFTLEKNKPLLWQGWRKLLQLIETQSAKSKWV